MQRMREDIKQLWLDALRGGEYAQGRVTLSVSPPSGPNRFCCLGVLCDLYARHTGEGKWLGSGKTVSAKEPGAKRLFQLHAGYNHESYLPTDVREWAGLRKSDPPIEVAGEGAYGISELNDKGYTFEQLADFIEEQL